MNCPGHMLLFGTSCGATATCRCATRRPRRCIATSSRARCTGSRASATSRRTTRTSSAPGADRRPRSTAASSSRSTSTRSSASSRARSSRPGPTNKLGTDEEWDFTEGELRRRSSGTASSTCRRGRGLVLRAEDRPPHDGRARPLVADGDDPARRADAGALRAHLHGPGQPRAHAVRDPPRAARLARALHRDPHRALRRRVPVLARARAGARDPRRRGSIATRRARSASASRGGYRVEVDERDETLGKRIRDAELEKVPFVVVYGDRESDDARVRARREQSTRAEPGRRGRSRRAGLRGLAHGAGCYALRLQAGADPPLTSGARARGVQPSRVRRGNGPLLAAAFDV